MKIIQQSSNSIFNYQNLKGIKLLTMLRLGLTYFRDFKLKLCFQDSLNPICNCGTDLETTPHFLPHCPRFSNEILILINNIWNIDNNILNLNISRL